MQLIIERDSGAVTIDGRVHIIDMQSVSPEITRVQWLDDTGTIYFRDGRVTGIGDIFRFKAVIDFWHEKQTEMRMR